MRRPKTSAQFPPATRDGFHDEPIISDKLWSVALTTTDRKDPLFRVLETKFPHAVTWSRPISSEINFEWMNGVSRKRTRSSWYYIVKIFFAKVSLSFPLSSDFRTIALHRYYDRETGREDERMSKSFNNSHFVRFAQTKLCLECTRSDT